MKLLLVEDEEKLATHLLRGLREEGHQVDRCSTVHDAREQARSIDYDVVVLDWMLPDGDGLELLREWRRAGLRVPVDAEAALTAREHALAAELFGHAGEVLSRTHLLRSVWGTGFEGDPNVLDVYVGYLRQKLARVGASVEIRAVRGVGFRLVVPESDP